MTVIYYVQLSVLFSLNQKSLFLNLNHDLNVFLEKQALTIYIKDSKKN